MLLCRGVTVYFARNHPASRSHRQLNISDTFRIKNAISLRESFPWAVLSLFRSGLATFTAVLLCIFSQGYFYTFFSFLLFYGELGVGVLGLGSWIGFVGFRFSVNGLLGLLCEAMFDWQGGKYHD